jgi:xylan 1,4-beta-xylosidase
MPIIHNPILPGFNPDPSIVRVGTDYYTATSTFEWLPGIALQRVIVAGHHRHEAARAGSR